MLYACRDKQWKIADFGLTVEGATDRAVTTHDSRGTPGYRAPELLAIAEKIRYTNKCDIWAIGCILFEIIHKRRPFLDDYAVRLYQGAGESATLPIDLPGHFEDESSKSFLSEILSKTLNHEPSKRPSARELAKPFKTILMEKINNSIGTNSLEKTWRVVLPELKIPLPRTSTFITKLTV